MPISFLGWDRDRSFNGRDCHSVVVSMGPPLKMLETVNAKLKPKPEGEVKEESKACSTPSPSKKLATEMGKKISCLPGDTSLVKELVATVYWGGSELGLPTPSTICFGLSLWSSQGSICYIIGKLVRILR